MQLLSERAGELTGIVTPLVGQRRVRPGRVTFYVDETETAPVAETDAAGRVRWERKPSALFTRLQIRNLFLAKALCSRLRLPERFRLNNKNNNNGKH